jgi:hypothetical protein
MGSQFVAVGAGGSALLSLDGNSWTAVGTGSTAPLRALTFGAGSYCAVGDAGANLRSQ